MWELDQKECWAPKNWCFQIVVLEKTLESLLDSKEVKPVNPKGNQLSIHWKDWCWSWSSNTLASWGKVPTHWKRPWCWERLRAWGEGGDRGWDGCMVSPINGHEFEQTVRDSERQGNLACWSPWGHKELDMTEGLNNNRLTLFDLRTNWTYKCAFRTKFIYMEGTYYSSFLFIPTLY